MVHQEKQLQIMKKVEALLERFHDRPPGEFEEELWSLGFAQKGGDPAAVAMEHVDLELYLEIELDEDGKVHGYVLLPFSERQQKQEKFRW